MKSWNQALSDTKILKFLRAHQKKKLEKYVKSAHF